MATVRFNPVEIAYKTVGDKPLLELYGKTSEGKQICVQVNDFAPYFWVLDADKISDEKIKKVEEHKKNFLGKEITAKKVFVSVPSDVPAVRGKFNSLEADIPFTRRFLIDRKITPLLSYDVEGDYATSNYKCEVFAAKKIRYVSDDMPELKMLALDIETHTKFGKEVVLGEDPIIMLALYGENIKKVLTWKKFDHKLDYVEVLENEAELLKRFGQLLEEHKPDVLTGFFSDGFDLPYIKARAEKLKVTLNLGLDNSPIKVKKGTIPTVEITGIAHIDVFRFVKRIFRTTFTSFKLNDVAKELLNEEKVDVDLEKLFDAWNENNDKLAKYAEYNLKDAQLTYDLMEKLMPNVVEFTKLVGLTPAEVSRMSFSQLVEWYLIKESAGINSLVPNRPDFNEERKRRGGSYEGGYVYEPTPGLYKDVAVFDFRSLYPTIISAHNISPDTLIYGKDSKDGVLKGISFSTGKKGFISSVIDNVIQRRLQLKKLAKKSSNDKTLEARQLALKTIANSIYGYYGFFGARWYNLECAKAITAYGRHHIQDVIAKAKEAGLQVLYSDTDSVFIALNGKTMDDVNGFVDDINKNLPGIMGLEFEDLYKSGIFVAAKGSESGAKKRYALMKENGKLKVRGFETVRRNLSLIAKETQEKVLSMILNGEPADDVVEYATNVINELRAKKVPTAKVMIKTQITRDIKSYDNVPPHVAIAMKMQERGVKVGAGTIIRYVVVGTKGIIRDRSKLPEDVREGEYDAEYYISNQVIPAIGKILEVIGYDSSELGEKHKQKKLEGFFG